MIFQNTTSIYLVTNKNMGELNHIILSPKLHDALLPQVHRTCRMFSRQGDPLMNLHGHFQAIITSQVGPFSSRRKQLLGVSARFLFNKHVAATCGNQQNSRFLLNKTCRVWPNMGIQPADGLTPFPKIFVFPMNEKTSLLSHLAQPARLHPMGGHTHPLTSIHYHPFTSIPGIYPFNSIDPSDLYWLVVSTPLKNMKVSWDYSSQYMEIHKIHVPNHHFIPLYRTHCQSRALTVRKLQTTNQYIIDKSSTNGGLNGKIHMKTIIFHPFTSEKTTFRSWWKDAEIRAVALAQDLGMIPLGDREGILHGWDLRFL